MYCSKCGKEVQEGYEFCMNCGTKVESGLEPFDESVKEKSPKNGKKISAIFILTMIIVGIIVFVVNVFSKDEGYYENIPWGTSADAIYEIVRGPSGENISFIKDEEENTVSGMVNDYKGMQGVSAFVSFHCNESDQLSYVGLVILGDDSSVYSDEIIMASLMEEFDELYGPHVEDPEYVYIWKTKESQIKMFNFGNIMVFYEDIDTVEE